MKRVIVIILILFMTPSIALGAEKNCENTSSNMDQIRDCLEKETELELQTSLERLLQLIQKKGMKDAAIKLIKSQNVWQDYRNSSCEYMYEIAIKSSKSDLFSSDLQANCLTEFNKMRIKIINNYHKICYKNIEWCSQKQ
jgi:uncharacterized protein YecT (DUF1311 family)